MSRKPHIEKWVLSPHAASRMAERKINSSDIELILNDPDWMLQQGPKWILAKNFKKRNDNLLAAVIIEKEDARLWIVLTVMVRFELKRE